MKSYDLKMNRNANIYSYEWRAKLKNQHEFEDASCGMSSFASATAEVELTWSCYQHDLRMFQPACVFFHYFGHTHTHTSQFSLDALLPSHHRGFITLAKLLLLQYGQLESVFSLPLSLPPLRDSHTDPSVSVSVSVCLLQARTPRSAAGLQQHSLGEQAGGRVCYASAESLESMADAELPLGFSRSNILRQSLPLARSPSQAKLRAPGMTHQHFCGILFPLLMLVKLSCTI